MNFSVRDGRFDVAVVAGPRVEIWPSAGVRILSVLCAEMGLTVGQFGGESLTVRGVIPLPGTGGIVLIEDVQRRIHRIHARAIVRVISESTFPELFPGWYSQGVITLATAERLRAESHIQWNPCTVLLGTGNRALRFGSSLLESGSSEVFCVESYAQWGAKRFAGWEVERRRFEMAGGKLIEAKPLQLIPNGPMLWQLRLRDSQGIRVLDVARVVSAGPFQDLPGVKEHPPGSFLFELSQTAPITHAEDVEGWALEEERGNWLASKIVKALVTEFTTSQKEKLDQISRRTRRRLKRHLRHRENPFTPAYQGKWIEVSDAKRIRSFKGVPQKEHLTRTVASIECFEEIPCTLCHKACPTSAIQIGKTSKSKEMNLNESACTACGLCLTACPSGSIAMIREEEDRSVSQITLPWRGSKPWSANEFATLVNRRGESLCTGRITEIVEVAESSKFSESSESKDKKVQLLQVEVPTHLLWEARGLKRGRLPASSDEAYLAAVDQSSHSEKKIEITLNGEKRLVRDRLAISLALYEMGQWRTNDVLFCKDGSCGLCQISVDGITKLACQTRIHRGMAIRISEPSTPSSQEEFICPCLGITQSDVLERLKQGKLHSPEAVLSVTHVGEGKCHGQLCMENFRRVLLDQGLPVAQWIDWRFPWSDWILNHN